MKKTTLLFGWFSEGVLAVQVTAKFDEIGVASPEVTTGGYE